MDGRQFDEITRDFLIPTRRSVIAAAATAVLTALLGSNAADDALSKRKQRKAKNKKQKPQEKHDPNRVQASAKKKKKKACKGGKTRCGKRCVDLRTNSAHCGACGNGCGEDGSCQGGECVVTCGGTVCSFPNASAACWGNTCEVDRCNAGWGRCDGIPSDGCQTNLLTDVEHCGECFLPCSSRNATPTCEDGVCGVICHDGFANCDGFAYTGCEVDTRTDRDHCGRCDRPCYFPQAHSSCDDGVCTMGACAIGGPAEWFPIWEDCDGDPKNGCEADLQSDPAHCGACGRACPDGKDCWLGECVLPCEEGGPCRVFVTANIRTGGIGGLAGADALCQREADFAGLPGAYMAWLSDDTDSPSTRFLLKATGPYRTVDGVTVADDWADLTDGALAETIFVTADGYFPGNPPLGIWTHTRPDGTAGGVEGTHCENWTGGLGTGDAGWCGLRGADWTENKADYCFHGKRFYCFQQSD
jgi:hypothetical protein